MKLSKRIEQIKLSAVIKIADKVREMEANGEKVIRLETGEPHFATPSVAVSAAAKAMANNQTHYSHSRGLLALRELICRNYNKKFKTKLDPGKHIIITPGGKQAIFYSFLATIEKGDEVIIPEPGWVSYEEMVRIADGTPVPAATQQEKKFELRFEDIESKLTKKTKAIILNSPNNPTGRIIDGKVLKKINDFCQHNDILLIVDEIYDQIIFRGNRHYSILSYNPGLKNCILINGFSKTYAMTGWRLGYLIANDFLINGILKLQQNSITCPSTFSQFGAIAAIKRGDGFIKKSRLIYEENRDILVKELSKIPKIKFIEPQGGLYAFIDISKINKNSYQFCEDLLNRCKVSAVPGISFGKVGEGYIRICLATDKENIIEFIKRIKQNYGQ